MRPVMLHMDQFGPLHLLGKMGRKIPWMQIARDQTDLLGDSVGTDLAPTDYHRVVEGFGAKGFVLRDIADAERVFNEAKACARAGTPVLINAMIGRTDFRKGSISV